MDFALYVVGLALMIASIAVPAVGGWVALVAFLAGAAIFMLGLVVEDRRYRA